MWDDPLFLVSFNFKTIVCVLTKGVWVWRKEKVALGQSSLKLMEFPEVHMDLGEK